MLFISTDCSILSIICVLIKLYFTISSNVAICMIIITWLRWKPFFGSEIMGYYFIVSWSLVLTVSIIDVYLYFSNFTCELLLWYVLLLWQTDVSAPLLEWAEENFYNLNKLKWLNAHEETYHNNSMRRLNNCRYENVKYWHREYFPLHYFLYCCHQTF